MGVAARIKPITSVVDFAVRSLTIQQSKTSLPGSLERKAP
jgi:hypothetical protein